jgi:hypothetical protein
MLWSPVKTTRGPKYVWEKPSHGPLINCHSFYHTTGRCAHEPGHLRHSCYDRTTGNFVEGYKRRAIFGRVQIFLEGYKRRAIRMQGWIALISTLGLPKLIYGTIPGIVLYYSSRGSLRSYIVVRILF